MNLRRVIVPVHRDVGFLVAAMTVVYAVSGVAVNHVADFNPSYRVETRLTPVGEIASIDPREAAATALSRLGLSVVPTAVVPTGPGQVKVFLDGRTLTVTFPDGVVHDETITRRPVLYSLNYLHLNRGKGWWTWLADAYAVALAVLALTGIFIVPGRKGLGGRGKWLLLIGIVVPLFFVLIAL